MENGIWPPEKWHRVVAVLILAVALNLAAGMIESYRLHTDVTQAIANEDRILRFIDELDAAARDRDQAEAARLQAIEDRIDTLDKQQIMNTEELLSVCNKLGVCK